MEKRDFFISYTKTDEPWAVWIANALISHGYTVYIQKLDIRPGDNFIEKMNEFLKNSGNFIAVWSKAYSKSPFCMTELQAAFNAWHKKQISCFLPVRIDNHPMEPLYSALVSVHLPNRGVTSETTLMDAVRYAVDPSGIKAAKTDIKKSGSLSLIFYLSLVCDALCLVFFGAFRWGETDSPLVFFFASLLLCVIGLISAIIYLILGFRTTAEYGKGYNYFYGVNGVEQNYAKAREYFERAAAKGHRGALLGLGCLYHKGNGVEQNYGKARAYFEQAAAKGDDDALFNLGLFYYEGKGVQPDYIKARTYYEKAAKKGHGAALSNLGYFYDNGLGVKQNYEKARKYYEKAAEKGIGEALNNLGSLYEHGQGVNTDYAKAMEYYEKALDTGCSEHHYVELTQKIARLRQKLDS